MPVGVSVTAGPQWRSLAGRFSRPPVGDAIDRNLYSLGRDAVKLLADATPTGKKAKPAGDRMRARWRSTLVPTQHKLRINNTAFYSGYVLWGTRRQRANPALQRVITEQLPGMAAVTASRMLKEISIGLKG